MDDFGTFINKYKDLSNFGRNAHSFPKLEAGPAIRCIVEGLCLGFRLEGIEGFEVLDDGSYRPIQCRSTDRVDTVNLSSFVEETVRILLEHSKERDAIFEVVFSKQ